MHNIKLTIPAHRHLVQFSRQLYGNSLHIVNRYISKDSIPDIILTEIICKPGHHYKQATGFFQKTYDAELNIIIPVFFEWNNQYYNSKKFELSNRDIININARIDEVFENTLYYHYSSNKEILGISFNKSIDLFRVQFNIPEEMMSYDAMKKIIQRRKEKLKQHA